MVTAFLSPAPIAKLSSRMGLTAWVRNAIFRRNLRAMVCSGKFSRSVWHVQTTGLHPERLDLSWPSDKFQPPGVFFYVCVRAAVRAQGRGVSFQ